MTGPPAVRFVLFVLPAILLGAAPAKAASGAVARGDAAYARRSEGRCEGRAAPGPIREAVSAYEEAVREGAGLEAHWKLVRALFFEGEYVAAGEREKRAVFGRGAEIARAAESALAASIGAETLFGDAQPSQIAAALRGNPDAAAVCFWSAVVFASRGRVSGAAAALREGLADRLRRQAELVIALDPGYEAGGAHRLLGRIHAEVPKIPFLTPWVQRERAVAEVRRAFDLGPDQPWNQLLLGMTLLEQAPTERRQAIELLRQVAASSPRPDYAVEDAGAERAARDLLAQAEGG